jgi:type II secretory pathway component GspD/PulD (secretin)
LRALQVKGILKVVTRPQIMTLDGRAARVQVGEKVPFSSGISSVGAGQTSTSSGVEFLSVGVIMDVTPTINPDGKVTLAVVPEVSDVSEFLAVGSIVTGSGVAQTITAPRVTLTTADTVVSVNDGQTIVLGGLIQDRDSKVDRKIPWLGDLPHLGALFRYTQNRKSKSELLIVLTPHIIKDEADMQRLKDMEVSRVNWILCDAQQVHGDLGVGAAAKSTEESPDPDSNEMVDVRPEGAIQQCTKQDPAPAASAQQASPGGPKPKPPGTEPRPVTGPRPAAPLNPPAKGKAAAPASNSQARPNSPDPSPKPRARRFFRLFSSGD